MNCVNPAEKSNGIPENSDNERVSWGVSRRWFPMMYRPRRNPTMRTSTTKTIACWLAVLMALGVTGCSGQPLSTREKGTDIGALLGAGTGAIIGAAVGSPRAGAAIGGCARRGWRIPGWKRTAESGGKPAPDGSANQRTATGNRAAAPSNRAVQTATGNGISQRVRMLPHPHSPASG